MGESITEQEQVEWALRENEEKYRELAGSITDVFFAMDGDLRYTYWNKASEELTGIKAEDALGKSIFEIFPDRNDTRKAVAVYQKVLKTQQPQSFANEYQLGGKDFVFEISAYPTKRGLSVFVKDITEHNKAEKALKESEEKYRLLIENSNAAIMALDKDGIHLLLNSLAAKNLGGKPDDFVGKSMYDIFPKNFADKRMKRHNHVIKSGVGKTFEDLVRLPSGNRWFSSNIQPIKDLDGNTLGVQIISHDITGRKRAEEVLRESEQKHRRLFEETTDAIFIADAKTGILIDCNRAASELVGREKSELVGKHQRILHPPQELKGGFSRSFKQHIAEKEGQVLEAQVIAKNGEIKDVAIRASLVELKGKKCIQGIFRDITERKKAEEESKNLAKFPSENPNPVLRIAKDGKVLYANNAGFELLAKWESKVGGVPPERWRHLIAGAFKSEKAKEEEEEEVNGRTLSFVIAPVIKAGYANLYGRDITERKEVDQMLSHERDLMQALFENHPDFFYFKDSEARFHRVSKRFCDFFGLSMEDIVGKTDLELFPEEVREQTYSEDLHVIKTGTPLVNKEENAGGVWVLTTKIPWFDKEGNIIGLFGISRDITDRKKAEEKIKNILESSPDAITVTDLEGNITECNEATLKLHKFSSKEEIIGKSAFMFFPKREQERAIENLKKTLKKGSLKNVEYTLVTKDGVEFSSELSASVINDASGKPVAFVAITKDITERKKAEDEIIRTKEYLQNIIDSASEIIISFDTNNRVTSWNNTAEFITGYKQRGIIGRQIHKLNVFDNPSEIADYIKSICDGHKVEFDELILRTKDGAKRIIQASSSAITDDKGHYSGILFIGKDITHDREAHGRLLKGNSYLIVDKNNRSALDLFVDLTKSDYNGLFVTRANPEIIKDMFSSTDIQIVLLNQDKLGGFEHISDFDGLIAAVKDFSTENTDSVILLDRIDYLITRFSFERFVESLYQINNVISKNNSILLVYLNPSFLDTRQMAFIEAELQPLPGQKIEGIEIEDELFDILRFIYEQNQNNLLVSFKKISREFSIVRSTAAKRLRMLEDTGLVFIKKQGKLKTARVSDKGKTLLNKRQII